MVDNEDEISYTLKQSGVKITRRKRARLTEEEAVDFFQQYMEKEYFSDLVTFMTSGDVIVYELCRPAILQTLVDIFGPLDVTEAKNSFPTSFIARFATDEVHNCLYYNSSLAEASREIQFFFPSSTIKPIPTSDYTKMFLEEAIYPTLLTGLTALCKEKPENPTTLAEQTKAITQGSLQSLKPAETADVQQGVDDWLPPKVLLKPANQLQLNEKQLEEELTRILNANNPHAPQNIARYNNKERVFKPSPNMEHTVFHFEFDGYLIFNEEERPAEELFEDDRKKTAKNQFNFSERASQTVNNPYREKTTNTDPPPQRPFSFTVNQFAIYDAYMEDVQQKEKAAKEKTKAAPAAGVKHKDEDKTILLPTDAHSEDVYYKSSELRKMIVIMERMANQNTFDDIAQDYKYWEDASDELGDRKSGRLLPLWKFVYLKEKKKQVTATEWNPKFGDMFVVGYGSYDFSHQGPGLIAIFTLKNPSYPETTYVTESGVLCMHFHPQHPSMLAVGLYDGSVLVYNLQKKGDSPIYKSTTKGGRHNDPVWQVCWQKDDLDDNLNFFSVSSDGRITQWTLLKNELLHTDVISLRHDHSLIGTKDEDKLFSLAGGCCFDFNKKQEHLFIVGTEEGRIYKCSKDYSSQYLLTFEGHQMAVYAVRYNPFNHNYFLSASSDWTVKLWDQNEEKPIMTFDLNASVGDLAWAPYSSTVFAAVTAEGKVYVFDLSINKYAPMCEQQVVKKAKLTHISFNAFEPILLVGDDAGNVVSLKLSPNLRKKTPADEQVEKFDKVIFAALGKTES